MHTQMYTTKWLSCLHTHMYNVYINVDRITLHFYQHLNTYIHKTHYTHIFMDVCIFPKVKMFGNIE